MKLLHLLLLLFSLQANARVITEDFVSTTHKDSSTAIWNFSLGYLHTELRVFDIDIDGPPTPVTSHTVEVSDGSDGPFDVSTYAQFGTVVGNHITINAFDRPILKVTRFHLDSSYTLSSINGPLVIHSLSTVNIDGVITCSGENGSAAVGATGGAGGAAHCGGFAGGNGGNATTSGTTGLPVSGSVTGGGGGVYLGPAAGAGGGGGAAFTGNDGAPGFNSTPATNTGGNGGSGSTGLDVEFVNKDGSPGGGGGSGSATEGGGGGGAGGGTVIIHAVSGVIISATGAIEAFGGNGGTANSGGGGGGGGGGSIQIFTGANLELNTGTPVNVSEGVGTTPANVNAGKGGDGSFGRTWLAYKTFSGSGIESHPALMVDSGRVGFVSGTIQTATTKSFDTASTQAVYQSLTSSPSNSDITFQIAASDDDFITDDSGWLNLNAISVISNKRYVKFKILLNNSDAFNPTFVNDVSLTYDPGTKENFNFKSAGCGSVKKSTNSPGVILLLLLPLLIALQLRKPKTVRIQKKK